MKDYYKIIASYCLFAVSILFSGSALSVGIGGSVDAKAIEQAAIDKGLIPSVESSSTELTLDSGSDFVSDPISTEKKYLSEKQSTRVVKGVHPLMDSIRLGMSFDDIESLLHYPTERKKIASSLGNSKLVAYRYGAYWLIGNEQDKLACVVELPDCIGALCNIQSCDWFTANQSESIVEVDSVDITSLTNKKRSSDVYTSGSQPMTTGAYSEQVSNDDGSSVESMESSIDPEGAILSPELVSNPISNQRLVANNVNRSKPRMSAQERLRLLNRNKSLARQAKIRQQANKVQAIYLRNKRIQSLNRIKIENYQKHRKLVLRQELLKKEAAKRRERQRKLKDLQRKQYRLAEIARNKMLSIKRAQLKASKMRENRVMQQHLDRKRRERNRHH